MKNKNIKTNLIQKVGEEEFDIIKFQVPQKKIGKIIEASYLVNLEGIRGVVKTTELYCGEEKLKRYFKGYGELIASDFFNDDVLKKRFGEFCDDWCTRRINPRRK